MSTDGEFLLSILEQVGSKVGARNSKVRRVLNRLPPVITQKQSGLDPVSNGLLAGLGFSEPTQLSGETGLSTANSDRALESKKVRFIHEARLYTNPFVRVNNSICVTDDKSACMVSSMAKKSNVAHLPVRMKRARKAPPNPLGADNRTLAQRLEIAMALKSGQLGRTYTEKDLVSDANKAAGATEADPLISQQAANAIINGKVTRSTFTAFLAMACGVNPGWLANGSGNRTG